MRPLEHLVLIVPTLCVVTHPVTLCVTGTRSVLGGIPTLSVGTIDKPTQWSYFAAQELKRCSSCSPLSAQKLTSICTWLAMFSGVVGMSFRTSLASNGTA